MIKRSSSDNPKRRKKFKRLLISDFHIETNYKMKLISKWIDSKFNLFLRRRRRSEEQIFAKTSTRKHINVEAKSNNGKKKFKRQSKKKKELQKIINKLFSYRNKLQDEIDFKMNWFKNQFIFKKKKKKWRTNFC
jgi:hypothetical protein